MKKLFIILIFCGCTLAGYGQTVVPLPADSSGLPVIKDPRVDMVIQKQTYLNLMALRNIPGYRVQVLSTMDRNKATSTKAQLMQLFPAYRTYLSYQSPYFRVRIGDFRSRSEAAALQQELSKYFESGVFTVRDVITVNPEKEFLQQQ